MNVTIFRESRGIATPREWDLETVLSENPELGPDDLDGVTGITIVRDMDEAFCLLEVPGSKPGTVDVRVKRVQIIKRTQVAESPSEVTVN